MLLYSGPRNNRFPSFFNIRFVNQRHDWAQRQDRARGNGRVQRHGLSPKAVAILSLALNSSTELAGGITYSRGSWVSQIDGDLFPPDPLRARYSRSGKHLDWWACFVRAKHLWQLCYARRSKKAVASSGPMCGCPCRSSWWFFWHSWYYYSEDLATTPTSTGGLGKWMMSEIEWGGWLQSWVFWSTFRGLLWQHHSLNFVALDVFIRLPN